MNATGARMITAARGTQQWMRSRPRLTDVLFAAVVMLFSLADLVGETVAVRTNEPDAIGIVMVVIGSVSLVWRRTAPVAVLVFVVGLSVVFYSRDYGSFMAAVGVAAFYAVAAHEDNRRTAWISLAIGYAIIFGVASAFLLDGPDGYRWSNALSMTLTVAAAVVAGAVIRNKEEIFADTKARAERAEAERKNEAERAVTRERLRIAREMHDVVAHGMSLITVQAAAAQEVALTHPDDAARLMHSVEATSRDALAEMRRMLGVLRSDERPEQHGARGELVPQPSLADLEATIAQCSQAGIPTELTVDGDRRPLPPGIELAAFRIVQEALTNTIKHGGGTTTASVTLGYGAATLDIEISDTGRGAVSELTRVGGGHGLIGMRERVEIYGGHLTAGPRPGGGYLVRASLPVNPRSDRPAVMPADPEGATSP